ncbi:hypothetical protein ACQ86N_13850 [Puia sp. P3]|uniref:hypothetical protein n=1 Tax=Puia sp. P3 TaxID=3423952 RepID=UPI003D67AD64
MRGQTLPVQLKIELLFSFDSDAFGFRQAKNQLIAYVLQTRASLLRERKGDAGALLPHRV